MSTKSADHTHNAEATYRCIRAACPWEGLRSAAVHRVVGERSHFFCPLCHHPARLAVLKLPLCTQTPADEPVRVCSRCGIQGRAGAEFGYTRDSRYRDAKMRVRVWCRDCTRAYYRERSAQKRLLAKVCPAEAADAAR